MPHTRGSPCGTGCGYADTGQAGGDPAYREDPNRPRSTRIRVPRLQDQAGQAAHEAAGHADQEQGSQGSALCISPRKIPPTTSRTKSAKRTRRKAPVSTQELINEINPVIRGWANTTARPISAGSSTSSTAGLCDASVASSHAMAQRRLETAPGAQADWRIRACTPDFVGSFLNPR